MFLKSFVVVVLANVCWLAVASLVPQAWVSGLALGPSGIMVLFFVLPPVLGWRARAAMRSGAGVFFGVGAAYGVFLMSLAWIDRDGKTLDQLEKWAGVSALLAASSVGLTVAGYMGFQICQTWREIKKIGW